MQATLPKTKGSSKGYSHASLHLKSKNLKAFFTTYPIAKAKIN
jgi:hypothetical protein